MTEAKRMDIAEFRRLGYLQEANRRFFHPLGLALATVTHANGTESLACVYDERDDPEGWIFGYSTSPDPDAMWAESVERAAFIDAEIEKRRPAREALMGGVIQAPDGKAAVAVGMTPRWSCPTPISVDESEVWPIEEKVYEVVKFVNPRDAVAVLEGLAVHAVAGPHDADCHGILRGHPQRDGCMVSFHDVLTDDETARTDIRNFVEVIVP